MDRVGIQNENTNKRIEQNGDERSVTIPIVTITLYDNMKFEIYEKCVMDKIINVSGPPSHVIWDLSNLTSAPMKYIIPQVRLMKRLKSKIWDRIVKSTIIVNDSNGGNAIRRFLDLIFTFYKPQRPIEIIKKCEYKD